MSVAVADVLIEMQQRLRRVETRLTRYMEAQGFETHTQKPRFEVGGRSLSRTRGTIYVGTPNVGAKELLACVPPDWHVDDEIDVININGNELIFTFYVPEKRIA